MLTNDQLHAIQAQPYKPWTRAQQAAHDAAIANGWTAESTNPGHVIYRRGSDYVEIAVVTGLVNLDTGCLAGNGRITYGHTPQHHFERWESVTRYLDRPKGRPYRGQP